jgi:hypothetical protein
MSQMTWTYIDDQGSLHEVGLFHGDTTGHLLVYCNGRIVVIDFNVLATKHYTFFINEELCDIMVEEKDGKFLYGFKIDQQIDTPRNRGRRKMIRSEVRQALVIAGIFLLLILLTVYLLLRFNN